MRKNYHFFGYGILHGLRLFNVTQGNNKLSAIGKTSQNMKKKKKDIDFRKSGKTKTWKGVKKYTQKGES